MTWMTSRYRKQPVEVHLLSPRCNTSDLLSSVTQRNGDLLMPSHLLLRHNLYVYIKKRVRKTLINGCKDDRHCGVQVLDSDFKMATPMSFSLIIFQLQSVGAFHHSWSIILHRKSIFYFSVRAEGTKRLFTLIFTMRSYLALQLGCFYMIYKQNYYFEFIISQVMQHRRICNGRVVKNR